MKQLIGLRNEDNGSITAIFIQDKYTVEVYGIVPEKLNINILECGGGGGENGEYTRTWGKGGGSGG